MASSTDDTEPPPTYSIRAVQRVCDILDHLKQLPHGAALPDVADVAGLPKSSAFRYLVTLESRHYVRRDPASQRYRLGPAFLSPLVDEIRLLAAEARPHLERLSLELGETATLAVLEGTRVVCVDAVESTRTLRRVARQGDQDLLHSTALGKAISAHLPDDHVLTILAAEGMPRLTPRTITDSDSYLSEVAEVRRRGYAVEDGENDLDGRGIAVPVQAARLPAALGLNAPAGRLPHALAGRIAERLREATDELADLFAGPAR